jgi:hypothetical protein
MALDSEFEPIGAKAWAIAIAECTIAFYVTWVGLILAFL